MEDNQKKGLQCDQCEVVCISKASLEIHKRSHSGIKPFSCFMCGKTFSRKGNCQRHESSHSGERPFECGVCFSRYTSKGSLMKHMQFHTGENLLSCDICSRKFNRKSQLRIHMRIHTGEKPFQCSTCNKGFSVAYDLKLHRTIHEDKVMSCSICGKTFSHLGSFKGHMHRHTQKKTFKCHVCGVGFHANCNLKVHMRIHTGEKPFKCTICNKAFARGGGLREHNQIHEREKLHPEAEKASAEVSARRKCDDETHYCAVCHKRYNNKYSLKQHMKIHAENPIRCSECLMIFTSFGYLKKHRDNKACHIKKYRCPLCESVIISKSNIIKHIKSTHASDEQIAKVEPTDIETAHQCSVCQQHFATKRSCLWHEICIHKKIEEIDSDGILKRDPACFNVDSTSQNDAIAFSSTNVCNFVEVPCDNADGKNSDESSRESFFEEGGILYPENRVFIKEEVSDEDKEDQDMVNLEKNENRDLRACSFGDEINKLDFIEIKEEKHEAVIPEGDEYC